MSNIQELVVLVDEQDRELGLEEKLRAHELGLLHRAFSVFIFRRHNDVRQILLQQRNLHKYHAAGLWTNTCCSHPRQGEAILAAGKRRLQEEMGLQAELRWLGSFCYRAEFANGLIEHEYDHVLVGEYDGSPIDYNLDEVNDIKWISIADLESQLASQPANFSPWLAGALAIVKAHEVD